MTDIVVLNDKIHGLNPEAYAETIRNAPLDATVSLARTPVEERTLLMEASVATGYQIDPELVEASETLELFVCTFAGTDHRPSSP